MNNESYNLNSLTKKEIAIILESLLFASSTDVCSEWYKKNVILAFNVAQKIRKCFPDVTLDGVFLYENENFEFHDEHSKEIKQYFPEIIKNFKV